MADTIALVEVTHVAQITLGRSLKMIDFDHEYKIQYRWEYDLEDFPESVKIQEYVNDSLREIMDVREDIVRKAAVAILRAKGYVVIEPKEEQ